MQSPTALADDQPPGGIFVDDDVSVHQGYIEAIAEIDVTRGCDDDRFCPTRPVARGEMAAFVVRALGLAPSSTDHFTDDDGSIFEADINALAAAGITRGCGDGTRFCPDRAVTRGELAAFLRRADRLPESTTDQFVDDESSVFEADIDSLAAAGLVNGCNPPDNTRYCPDRLTTRGQFASVFGRFLDLTPHQPPARDLGALSVETALWTWWPDLYDEARAVARCESSFNPRAVNPRGFHGIFQIAEEYHRSGFERVTGQSWADGIYTAFYNAQYARHLYDQTGDWRAWGCTP